MPCASIELANSSSASCSKCSLGLNGLVSIELIGKSDIDPKVAKLVPLVLIVPINYFVLNKLVFKKKA